MLLVPHRTTNLIRVFVMPAKSPPGIQSVEVGGRLLRALIGSAGAMNLTPLAKAAKMPATKARRYLVSFIRLGLVAQDPQSGKYNLGPLALGFDEANEIFQPGISAVSAPVFGYKGELVAAVTVVSRPDPKNVRLTKFTRVLLKVTQALSTSLKLES